MTQIYPTIRTMTFEEASEFGEYHQGLMMEHGCVSYRLSAGSKDNMHVLKSGAVLYVVTINSLMEYVSLDIYMSKTEDAIDSIFLQGDYAISECVGNEWRSLSLIQITTRLMELFA